MYNRLQFDFYSRFSFSGARFFIALLVGFLCFAPSAVAQASLFADDQDYEEKSKKTADNRPTQFDFDGDRKADISVFRPAVGIWYLQRTRLGFNSFKFGIPTDKIAPADYDGDGRTDLGIFRNDVWYLLCTTTGFKQVQFGQPGDIVVGGDWDNDAKADVAVYRPGLAAGQQGSFRYIGTLNNPTGNVASIPWGFFGDVPVAGDYDGDGRFDAAVFTPANGNWSLLQSTAGTRTVLFGSSIDKPVPADYDGDEKTDVAVYRPTSGTNTYFVLGSLTGFRSVSLGIANDVPVPADYDGDGKADPGIFRPSNGLWFVPLSNQSYMGFPFGISTDKPIPAAFLTQ